jgi:integrase/recombinase XerD
VPPRKLPKTLTADEATALLGRPNIDCPTGLRNRAMLELMLGNGLRVSECCGVHLRDVDWKTRRLRLRSEVAKGGREAVLPLAPDVIDWLDRWKPVRREYAAGAPWMFVTLRGGKVDRHYVWEMVSRYARKAGIEWPVHPHVLRHTFGTDLLRSGEFDIREVQEMLRHADVRTTMVYTHVAPERLAEKMNRRRRAA